MTDLESLISDRQLFIPDDLKVFQSIYKHFRGKKVGDLPGDGRPLLSRPDEFYLQSPASEGFLQGDILSAISPVWVNAEGEAVASGAQQAMVLSNECDTELRDENAQSYIRLCPIYIDEDLSKSDAADPQKRSQYMGNLKANYYTEYFWMPPIQSQGLVADIGHMFAMDLVGLHSLIEKGQITRVASLSRDAHYLLMLKIAWFFLRPVPDSRRAELEKLFPPKEEA